MTIRHPHLVRLLRGTRARTGAMVAASCLALVSVAACGGEADAPPAATGTPPAATTTATSTATATATAPTTEARAGTADEIAYATPSADALPDMQEQTEEEAGPPRGYSFTWPEMTAHPSIGEAVRAEMQAIYDDFQAQLGAPPATTPPGAPPISQDVTITTEVIAASDAVIGIRLDIFKFYGANGGAESKTLWFDLPEGDAPAAQPATALLADDAAIGVVAARSQVALERSEIGTTMSVFAEGLTPTVPHFDALGFTADGDLIVEFDEGQVAATAAGSPRVVIPAAEIESLLSDLGVAAQQAAE